jgi:SAM-dependent methyltransferase
VPVHGIDISEPMLEQLRTKPGSERVGVTVGDFARTRVDGIFQLAYLVFNTITNLTTQDEQVACFRNAAAHLGPGGCFVIEVFVPELRRVPPGERVRAFDVRRTHLGFDEYTDFARQILYSHHYWLARRARPDGAPRRHVPARALGWLDPRAVHRREHLPRLGLGEARGIDRRRDGFAPSRRPSGFTVVVLPPEMLPKEGQRSTPAVV